MISTLQDSIREKLYGVDCVLAFETASDYLATNKMTHQRPAYYVYSTHELNIPEVECTIVDNYDSLNIIEERGMKCTSVTQTMWDLLRNDRCPQVTIECIADWYFRHNESYDDLEVPEDIKDLFWDYAEDAKYYFDD